MGCGKLMKVEWKLYEMDAIKNRHLRANLEYWKIDLLLNATKMVENIQKSRFLKVMSKGSEQLKNLVFLAQSRGEIAKADIDNMVDYRVDEVTDNTTIMSLEINPNYFSMNEMVQAKMGRRMSKYLASKSISRQELIDSFEGEIRKTYTKKFKGDIIEDDGKQLSIFN